MRLLFILLLSCFAFATVPAYSNSAQPGIFQAGGTANFVLLYPEDSASFRKIQMVDEKISIQIYRGFAVVKGEYKMYNTVDTGIKIKVGYPVNTALKATERGSAATQIFFDQLYALRSYTNGKENMFLVQPGPAKMSMDENNWYVWENSFKPKDTTTIVVYFVVNTNNASVRQGYTVENNNGFIYLLETGATWKQPILKGEIRIRLMDDLQIKDIRGLSPMSSFGVNNDDKILVYRFSNLSPTLEDNIVMTYTPNIEHFDFSYVSQKRQVLFGSIDTCSNTAIDETKLATQTFKNPYEVRKVNLFSLVGLLGVILVSVLGLVVVIWLFRLLIRFLKAQRRQSGNEI
jgi:hypothetical protein